MAGSKLVAVLLVALVASVSAQTFDPSDWDRVWSDERFGGFLYTCVTGNTLSGSYGSVGVVTGTISLDGREVNGTFHEAGFTDFNSGSFQWRLSQSKLSFKGKRWFEGQPCIREDWDAEEILSTSQTGQCFTARNDTGGTATGVWDDGLGSTMAMCIGADGFVEASLSGVITNTYLRGESTVSRVTIQTSAVGNSGYISVFQLTALNTLDELFYNINSSKFANFSSNLHGRRRWTRVSSVVTTCSASRNLVTNPWAGSYTDADFGQGRLHLCQSGSQVWGVYSELGYVTGTTTNNGLTLNGQFYDGGDSDKVSGPFTLTMSSDFDSFSGSWYFSRTPEEVIPWTEVRTSALTPTNRECLTPFVPTFGQPTVSGRWATQNITKFINASGLFLPSSFNSYLDICFNPLGTFTASYFKDETRTRGYMTGNFLDNGRSLQMQWYEDRRQGIEIQRLTEAGVMEGYRWDWPDIQLSDFFYCDDDETTVDNWWFFHRAPQYWQLNATTTPLLCERNADLLRYAVPSSDFPELFPPPSVPVVPDAPVEEYEQQDENLFSSLLPAASVSSVSPRSPGAPGAPVVVANNDIQADSPGAPGTPLADFFSPPVSPPDGASRSEDNAGTAAVPSFVLAAVLALAVLLAA